MQAALWRGDSLAVPKSQLSGETKAQKQQTPHEAGLVIGEFGILCGLDNPENPRNRRASQLRKHPFSQRGVLC
jgi:hypothetical protein